MPGVGLPPYASSTMPYELLRRSAEPPPELGTDTHDYHRLEVADADPSRAPRDARFQDEAAIDPDGGAASLASQHEFRAVQRQVDKLCTAHDDLVDDHARVSGSRCRHRLGRAARCDWPAAFVTLGV